MSNAPLPRRLGEFLLLKQLGAGGTADVYLAKSTSVTGAQRYCVVKARKTQMSADDAAAFGQRFAEEAGLLMRMSQRNIAPILDVGIAGDSVYLVLEHIQGADLSAVLRRCRELTGKGLPTSLTLYVISETLEALDYLHRLIDPETGKPLHVVHRDVSLSNVMINFEGEAKLIDFGLADSNVNKSEGQAGIVMGKLQYMAPEQARADVVDGRADQFATAIMLYELLTGRRFYEALDASGIMRVLPSGGYAPSGIEKLPADIRAIITRALSPEPAQRFASCGEMRDALESTEAMRTDRAGPRHMRAWMQNAFGDQQKRLQEEMAGFARMDADDPVYTVERTQSFRLQALRGSEGSSSSPTMAAAGDTTVRLAPLDSAAKELTQTPSLQTKRTRPRRVIAAALGTLLLCAAGVATVVARARAPHAHDPQTALPAPVAVHTPPPPPVVPVAPVASVAAASAAPELAHPPPTPPSTTPTKKPRATSATKDPQACAPAPQVGSTPSAQRAWLKVCNPKSPCLRLVRGLSDVAIDDIAQLPPQTLSAWKRCYAGEQR